MVFAFVSIRMHVFPYTGEASCVGASCSAHSKDQEVIAGDESRKTGDASVGLNDNSGVHLLLKELVGDAQHLGSKHDD